MNTEKKTGQAQEINRNFDTFTRYKVSLFFLFTIYIFTIVINSQGMYKFGGGGARIIFTNILIQHITDSYYKASIPFVSGAENF